MGMGVKSLDKQHEYRIHGGTYYRNYGKFKAASCKELYLEIYDGELVPKTKDGRPKADYLSHPLFLLILF